MQPDKRQIPRAFGAAAASYDAAAAFQRQVGHRLLERLEAITFQPERVLDLGAGTGTTTRAVMQHYRKAHYTALDIAPQMLAAARSQAPQPRRLAAVCGDAVALPFRANSFDLVFSNLALQWVHDLDRAFREIQRVLRPGGMLLFSSLGPDTLRELRQAWAAADGFTHVNRFLDVHAVGNALGRARLADPATDVEAITLRYERVRHLMRDLKAIGAHNVTAGRNRGLTGRARFRAMEVAYERCRGTDGCLPATYEVLYGHAWRSHTPPRERR